MSRILTSWPDYVNFRKPGRPEGKFSTFHARYDFASNFSGLQVDGMNMKTSNVYSEVTKIAFCYSALEHLEFSLGIQGKPEILAADLANLIRVCMPRGTSAINEKMPLTPNLSSRLEAFFEKEEIRDVRPVIEQFRHSLFHGKFTPTGWGMKGGKFSLVMLEGLGQVTLRKADETFTHWFESQSKN
jgi:hypothetical protein